MQLLLISSSNVHGYGYLDHAEPDIKSVLGTRRKVGFVPYALRDHQGYTTKVRERLHLMGYEVSQIDGENDLDGIDAIFVGGGNTWRLVDTLYERKMLDPIRNRVRNGLPYIGSSAGTNIAAPTLKTTNDMPIVQPPSFDTLGLISFQINPHYLDPEPDSKHKGETREERIREFLEENTITVVGLREGTMLHVTDGQTMLIGLRAARIFRRGQEPVEVPPGNLLDRYI